MATPKPAPIPKPIPSAPLVSMAKAAMNNAIKGTKPIGGGPTEPFNQAKADQIKKMITGMPTPPSTPQSPKPTFQQADDLAYLNKAKSIMSTPISAVARQVIAGNTKPMAAGLGSLGTGTNTGSIGNMQPVSPAMYKKGGEAKKYTKGGKINLDACGVSTHKKSKSSSSW